MLDGLRRYLGDPVATWRTGSPQSQVLTLLVLLVSVGLCFVVSVIQYALMPMTAYYVWLLIGMMLLRFRPLVILVVVTATAQVSAVAARPPDDRAADHGPVHAVHLPGTDPVRLEPAAERSSRSHG